MVRRLRSYVHLDGKVYTPGEEVSAQVAERIPNPKAWVGGALTADDYDGGDVAADDYEEEGEAPQRPAESDRKDAWIDYVLEIRGDLSEDDVAQMTKAELIAAADEAGGDQEEE